MFRYFVPMEAIYLSFIKKTSEFSIYGSYVSILRIMCVAVYAKSVR